MLGSGCRCDDQAVVVDVSNEDVGAMGAECGLPVGFVKGDGNVGKNGGNLVADPGALDLFPGVSHGLKDAKLNVGDVMNVNDSVRWGPFFVWNDPVCME